ncbi:polysaccharide biosynthesis tyrosine autokinase [Anabaena sp. FACHB-1237]|uniref:GumC family protein n=1 Tax=Anabaena sp. FACHB-1237 TaxID=2692769 RepID=UPI001681954F|nr:polysaccharide biosynthesis tyrosine autokinase [Anabaena sp. FACHB-1237]MBD2139653.1 polysaccharide biosynthesis tyrosine autokinase [Anabaena sp. FACHB-1237]
MELEENSVSLEKYWQILQRRWKPTLLAFLSVFTIAQLITFLKQPIYIAEAKLRFQRNSSTSSITGLGTEIGKLDPLVQQGNPLNTETEVIKSIPVIETTIQRINRQYNHQIFSTTELFLKNLDIKLVKGADILEISYKYTDPKIAAAVVNELVTVYLEESLSSKRSDTILARKFIENQLPKAELVVRQAESQLADFKEENKVVSLQEEANKAVDVIANLQLRINETQSQLANIQSQSQVISQQLGMNSQQALLITSLSQVAGVQDILKEIQQLESQLASKQTSLQDNHPEIISLKQRIVSLNKLIKSRTVQVLGNYQVPGKNEVQIGTLQQQLSSRLVELESNRIGLASQADTLLRLQLSYKQRLNNLPKLEEKQRQLERKLQAAQSTYSLLLQKLQESRVAENQNLGNASVISTAQIPDKPATSVLISYLSSALLAILAGLATIYILEVQDKTIKTVEEAQELLGFNVLAVLPQVAKFVKNNSHINRFLIRDFSGSSLIESYRILRSHLNFIKNDRQVKTIVVTSAVPQEGKSTVAANLAMVMAQVNRKVLLIDANLQNPTQHEIWDVMNQEGLSNIIMGNMDINDNIHVHQVMPNLAVLTAGIFPVTNAVLDSQKMTDLITNFSREYDLIIIDTPAMNMTADAAILGQIADGILLVVRLGIVDSINAIAAKELLSKSGQNVLGQVIN